MIATHLQVHRHRLFSSLALLLQVCVVFKNVFHFHFSVLDAQLKIIWKKKFLISLYTWFFVRLTHHYIVHDFNGSLLQVEFYLHLYDPGHNGVQRIDVLFERGEFALDVFTMRRQTLEWLHWKKRENWINSSTCESGYFLQIDYLYLVHFDE